VEKMSCILPRLQHDPVAEKLNSNTGSFMLRKTGNGSRLFSLLVVCGTLALASSTCEEDFTGGLLWPAWVSGTFTLFHQGVLFE
jgi:hypothetical protein